MPGYTFFQHGPVPGIGWVKGCGCDTCRRNEEYGRGKTCRDVDIPRPDGLAAILHCYQVVEGVKAVCMCKKCVEERKGV